jgi:hypothetical protein
MGPHSSRRPSFPFLRSVLFAALAIALPGCFVPAWSPGGYYGGRGYYGGHGHSYGPGGYVDYGRYAPPRRVYVPVYQDDDDDHHHRGNRRADWRNGARGGDGEFHGEAGASAAPFPLGESGVATAP